MTEDQNVPPPPVPPPPPPPAAPEGTSPQQPQPDPEQQEAALREELAKTRRRNKWLVAIAAVLGTVFVIAGGAVYIIYSRVSEAKESFEEVFRALPAQQALSSGQDMPMGQGMPSGQQGAAQSSSLALFASSMQGGGQSGGPAAAVAMAMDPQKSAQMLKAMSKYAERPIVKEFLADLRKDPDIAAAFKAKDEGNPLAVISYIQHSKGMDKLVPRYMARPEFLGLMMEFMADPEMQPFIRNMQMPGVVPGGMPGGQEEARPVAMPQQQYRQATARPGDEDGDGRLRMDPRAMQVPRGHRAGGTPIDEIDTE